MNQCVIKHLVLALDWRYNGRKFRIPTRSRVEVLAKEIRAGEFAQAQLCLEHVTKPSTTLEHEVWSCIHDTMDLGHDRSFKRLGWFPKENCPKDAGFSIRIFDYEEANGQQKIIVYQYDSGIQSTPPNESLNFIATSKHLRFLFPPNETFRGSWTRRTDSISILNDLEWLTWREALEQDTLETSEMQKIECTLCGKKVKTVTSTCGGLPSELLPVVTHEEVNADKWRERPNPRLHSQIEVPLPSSRESIANEPCQENLTFPPPSF